MTTITSQKVIQTENRENKTFVKALLIASTKRVRRTSNRKIWIVGSGNSKTPEKWYKVMYDEGLEEIVCDCPAYLYGMRNPCAHILATAIFVGSEENEY